MTVWKIEQLEWDTESGGVVTAHWRATLVDSETTVAATRYGSVGFTPDPNDEGFIPLGELDEAAVLAWVQGSVGQEGVESALAAEIEVLKNPPIERGLPWATQPF